MSATFDTSAEYWSAILGKWTWRYWIAKETPIELDENDPLKFALTGPGYNEAKDTRREIAAWIKDNGLKGSVYYAELDLNGKGWSGIPTFGVVATFENDADAALFKMRWM